ncbi:MAG: glycosyltransferase [Candidatus Helarchaeota archaeon]|nr:glycosyltransferase [Candidatus Helarchaeota archaeon]
MKKIKIDIVMWAKDGAKTLPLALKCIEKAIPKEVLNRKIFVDDHSIDNTVQIAKSYGWTIYKNTKGFIYGGMREAIKHVSTHYFASFEQDLFLSKNWWKGISEYIKDPKVAIVCGAQVYYPSPKTINAISNFYSEELSKFDFPCSLDNTIYQTEIIRNIGIPNTPIFLDVEICKRVKDAGYKIIRVGNIKSLHYRKNSLEIFRHNYKYGTMKKESLYNKIRFIQLIKSVIKQIRNLFKIFKIMLKTKCPTILIYLPLERLIWIKTFKERRKYWQKKR